MSACDFMLLFSAPLAVCRQ